MDKYLTDILKKSLASQTIPDGILHFTLGDILVDEKGKVDFYDWKKLKAIQK